MRPDVENAKQGELRGRGLRHLLVVTLADANRPLALSELAEAVTSQGATLPDQATKALSDALRWELRAGRVRRVRRGTYEFAGAPPSTLRWIRVRVNLLRSLLAEAATSASRSPISQAAAPHPEPSRTSIVRPGEGAERHGAV